MSTVIEWIDSELLQTDSYIKDRQEKLSDARKAVAEFEETIGRYVEKKNELLKSREKLLG